MRTVDYPAFGGRVIFKTRHLSMLAFEWINRQLAEPQEVLSRDAYQNLVYALGLTIDLEFHFQGDENPMLEELRDFWQAYQRSPEDVRLALAIQWRQSTHLDVIDEWVRAANAASKPFRDPARLPGNALTREEQEAARDKDDPLARSGALSVSSAAPVRETS